MTIHHFESTGEAYDACQCDDDVKTGDVLVIASERVVGLAWTWPVAVTDKAGKLHSLENGSTWTDLRDHAGQPVFTLEQITEALDACAALTDYEACSCSKPHPDCYGCEPDPRDYFFNDGPGGYLDDMAALAAIRNK